MLETKSETLHHHLLWWWCASKYPDSDRILLYHIVRISTHDDDDSEISKFSSDSLASREESSSDVNIPTPVIGHRSCTCNPHQSNKLTKSTDSIPCTHLPLDL
eukprot:scaffold387_cov266-Chaetoceros_neogracile.AAC.3